MKVKKEIPYLRIGSVVFPNAYLRMDATGVNRRVDAGAGIVNCQFGAQENELFKFVQYEDDTYTIEPMKYPGVFLRMDGNGVTTFNGKNLGTVNCQFGAYGWEHFRLHKQDNGSYTIESATFPGVFLRMDGNNVKSFSGSGSGSVTCQFTARSWEQFRIEADL